ncbi:methyltransferase domain-containing protein [Olleya sp. HaHaR_3_96]|uniref:methyltransferase domain-containing protein n=1 Tax=Olleya sp. HaHaR_3_96 TaxID=2745560 RepID=UPI001C4E600A|nr:methyltransferase domain-containing protein [Olleya sp. HaHaR_3_96]QXP61404.1 methyltransferase domain-containing protein [Olleya sp. HaHaR_3_96]
MKTILSAQLDQSEQNKIEMVDFYNEATEDYEFWSKDFNMHFGYYIPFKTNPFKRDEMLNQMTNQVISRFNYTNKKATLIDLGCGMGGSMRYAIRKHKNLTAIGVTLSNFQVKQGNTLLKGLKGTILKENYNNTSFKTNSFDSALAIESFCHSGHSRTALKETYRILKPDGKLVIADAFLKKEETELCYGGKYAYHKLCSHWSLEKLETKNNMVKKLQSVGFTNIKIEDASLRVAPSVLHVPFTIMGFFLKNLITLKGFKKESLHNLLGSFYALLSGLHMKSFGYYIITCTK